MPAHLVKIENGRSLIRAEKRFRGTLGRAFEGRFGAFYIVMDTRTGEDADVMLVDGGHRGPQRLGPDRRADRRNRCGRRQGGGRRRACAAISGLSRHPPPHATKSDPAKEQQAEAKTKTRNAFARARRRTPRNTVSQRKDCFEPKSIPPEETEPWPLSAPIKLELLLQIADAVARRRKIDRTAAS